MTTALVAALTELTSVFSTHYWTNWCTICPSHFVKQVFSSTFASMTVTSWLEGMYVHVSWIFVQENYCLILENNGILWPTLLLMTLVSRRERLGKPISSLICHQSGDIRIWHWVTPLDLWPSANPVGRMFAFFHLIQSCSCDQSSLVPQADYVATSYAATSCSNQVPTLRKDIEIDEFRTKRDNWRLYAIINFFWCSYILG